MTRPYVKKNVVYWRAKDSGKATDSASSRSKSNITTQDVTKTSEKSNHGEEKLAEPKFKRKVGRPRKEDKCLDSCYGFSQSKCLTSKNCYAPGENRTNLVLKRKVGRPRKIEADALNQSPAHNRLPVKHSAFIRPLRQTRTLVYGRAANKTKAAKQASKFVMRKCSQNRTKALNKTQSSKFLQSKRKLAEKYKACLTGTRRNSLRSANPALKDSATRQLRSRFSHKKEETVIKCKETSTQSLKHSLKQKQEAALAKLKELEEKIPISDLQPVVELDTDDVISSAWLPLAEHQPLSMEKRMMLRGCDPSHKCCQKRAIEMFDNCTQWEDPTYLYEMLSGGTSTYKQPSSSSPSVNTDMASTGDTLISNQTSEICQVPETLTLLQQTPEQQQLLLQQDLPYGESYGNAALKPLCPEAFLSHVLFQQNVNHKKHSCNIPKKRGRKRRLGKFPYQNQRKKSISSDTRHLEWKGNQGGFSSELGHSFVQETAYSKSNPLVYEQNSKLHQIFPTLSSEDILTLQRNEDTEKGFEQQGNNSIILQQGFQEDKISWCTSKQKSLPKSKNVLDPREFQIPKKLFDVCEQKLTSSKLSPLVSNSSDTFTGVKIGLSPDQINMSAEVNKSSPLNQLKIFPDVTKGLSLNWSNAIPGIIKNPPLNPVNTSVGVKKSLQLSQCAPPMTTTTSCQQIFLIPLSQTTQQPLTVSTLSQETLQGLCVPQQMTQHQLKATQTCKSTSFLQISTNESSSLLQTALKPKFVASHIDESSKCSSSHSINKKPEVPYNNIMMPQVSHNGALYLVPMGSHQTVINTQERGRAQYAIPQQNALVSQVNKQTLLLLSAPSQVAKNYPGEEFKSQMVEKSNEQSKMSSLSKDRHLLCKAISSKPDQTSKSIKTQNFTKDNVVCNFKTLVNSKTKSEDVFRKLGSCTVQKILQMQRASKIPQYQAMSAKTISQCNDDKNATRSIKPSKSNNAPPSVEFSNSNSKTNLLLSQSNGGTAAALQNCPPKFTPQVASTSFDGYSESALNYPTGTGSPGPHPLVSVVMLDSDSESESYTVKDNQN